MRRYIFKYIKIIALSCIMLLGTSIAAQNPSSLVNQEHDRYKHTLEMLSSYNQELVRSEQEWKSAFENRSQKNKEILQKLDNIDQLLRNNWHYDTINNNYIYVLNLWRSFVEDSFSNISGKVIGYNPPEIINYDEFLVENGVSLEKINTLDALYQQSIKLTLNQTIHFDLAQEEDSLQYNKILLYSGKLRSKLYQRLKKLNDNSIKQLSNDTIADLWREINIIPIRWTATFYSKMLEFKGHLNAGVMGYFFVAKEIFLFSLLVAFLFGFVRVFNKLVNIFENIASKSLKQSYRSKKHWVWPYLLTITQKSIPWLLLFLGIHPLAEMLERTTINELAKFVPYIDYYIIYKLAVIITSYTITKIKTHKLISISYVKQLKLLNALTGIYLLLSVNMAILHTINTVVGKAIVYGLFMQLFLGLGFLYIIMLIDRWRAEIYHGLCRATSKRISQLFKSHFRSFYTPIISFISVGIILLHFLYTHFKEWVGQFDFSKKISAKLFLVQVKRASGSKQRKKSYEKPIEYIKQFYEQEHNSNLSTKRKEFETCCSTIEHWLQNKNMMHSLIIHGPSGSGKSTLLLSLKKSLEADNFKQISLPQKIISPDELIDKLKELLGGEAQDIDLLIQEWRANIQTKIVVCIDDMHNLFLSHAGGLEAIKMLMKIINSDIDNIFWCVTCHRYAWFYISKVLDRYQCFDKLVALETWSAESLQGLILNRHKETNYELSFDDIFFTLEKDHLNDTMEQMKSNFFKVLWEQSNGNPAFAIRLWLKSLHYDGLKTLRICLPPEQSDVDFAEMGDEVHFICAAIIRHELLSIAQIKKITDQTSGVIARVLKTCQEKQLLLQDKNLNLRLNPDYTDTIIRTLKRKNYVH